MNVAALAKIFHGQMANARHSTRSCPLGIVMYLGASIDASLPNGIMFAETFVAKMEILHAAAQRKTAVLDPAVQYLVMIASKRSHWFQSARFQLALMAEVDKMPRLAEKVTAIGLVNS